MKKIILSLAIMVMASSLTAQVSVWDGSYEEFDTSNEKGLTEDNPFLIENAAQLAHFSTLYFCSGEYQNKYFKLTTDVDLNNMEWQPIGGAHSHISCDGFDAHFDGDNHVIYQLTDALFAYSTGSIENITVKESTFILDNYSNFGVITSGGVECKIENCHTYADIKIEGFEDYIDDIYVGSIAGGDLASVTIKNCTNHGNIDVDLKEARENSRVVVCGISTGGTEVFNCQNYGNINIYSEAKNIGTSGISSNVNQIAYCSNYGDINVNMTAGGDLMEMTCGGISPNFVGYPRKIISCFNKGDIVINVTGGTDESVIIGGGLVGKYLGGNDNLEIGINNGYNTGNVTINCSSGNSYAGGIIGLVPDNENEPVVNVRSCYNVGIIEAENIGGILNIEKNAVAEIDNCFMLNVVENNGYGESLAEDFMKSDEFVNMLNKYGNFFIKDTEPFVNEGYPVIDYSDMNETINVDDVVLQNNISVYPNPAKDFVKVSTDNGQQTTVKIYNTVGMLVGTRLATSATNEIEINVSDYKSGIYFINISNEEYNVTKKIVVE
ncbi:MAG: T9SS type A sorting domain-containing protein [Bacteroidales bacterium]|nr:T9SS type A sorting domain-containing protein [Bacteroidales bacterium]